MRSNGHPYHGSTFVHAFTRPSRPRWTYVCIAKRVNVIQMVHVPLMTEDDQVSRGGWNQCAIVLAAHDLVIKPEPIAVAKATPESDPKRVFQRMTEYPE